MEFFMPYKKDYRLNYRRTIAFAVEGILYHIITKNQSEDMSSYLRQLIKEYLEGKYPKGEGNGDLDECDERADHAILSFVVDDYTYNKLRSCAKNYGKSVSAVVRSILREILDNTFNPYRSFLLKPPDPK